MIWLRMEPAAIITKGGGRGVGVVAGKVEDSLGEYQAS